MSEQETAEFMLEIVQITRSCFELGVLHRDLKDENLLVVNGRRVLQELRCGRQSSAPRRSSTSRRLRLIDFGSGVLVPPGRSATFTDFDGTHTRTYHMDFTPLGNGNVVSLPAARVFDYNCNRSLDAQLLFRVLVSIRRRVLLIIPY